VNCPEFSGLFLSQLTTFDSNNSLFILNN
jgi:hypothetical protein